MHALIEAARAAPSIRILEGYEAIDLILEAGTGDGGRVTGVRLVRTEAQGTGTFDFMPASAVVVATGGAGALYSVTTNPIYARGEAIAFAARAGAVIADAEFVQFHPTAIDAHVDPAPLASEALRGEGAKLVNGLGERFMERLDAAGDLAQRDIVARGVFAEIAAGRGAFLDCRDLDRRAFPDRVPDRLRALQGCGHRSGDATHSGRAGCALPHGRRGDGPCRPHIARRPVGCRRSRVYGIARGEPIGVELSARGDRARRARGRRYSPASLRRPSRIRLPRRIAPRPTGRSMRRAAGSLSPCCGGP